VKFIVSEAGRQRVLATGKKNVHAYIEGDITGEAFPMGGAVSVRYNPFRGSHFYSVLMGQYVQGAEVADLSFADGDAGIEPVVLINNRRHFDVV